MAIYWTHTLPSLNCSSAWIDKQAPITFAIPASSMAKQIPYVITLLTNDQKASIFYHWHSTITDSYSNLSLEDFKQYEEPITILEGYYLEYYSQDSNKNTETVKNGSYTSDTNLPVLSLVDISHAFVKKNTIISIIFYTTSHYYQLKSEQDSQKDAGNILRQGLATTKEQKIDINSNNLEPGLNQLFLYAYDENNAHPAYLSLYIYRDDKAPRIRFTPGRSITNKNIILTIQNTEPAHIYYTINKQILSATIPNSLEVPSINDILYKENIILQANTVQEVQYIIQAIAIDSAQNTSEVIQKIYTIDQEPPILTIYNIPPGDNGAYRSPSGTYYLSKDKKAKSLQWEIQWSTNEKVQYSIEINSEAFGKGHILLSGQSRANERQTQTIPSESFLDGSQIVTLYTKDLADNIKQQDFKLITDNMSHTPLSIEPLLGERTSQVDVHFTWQDVNSFEEKTLGSGIEHYILEIATNRKFNNPIEFTTYLPQHNHTFTNNLLYFWRIRSIDNVGNLSQWSPARQLYIRQPYNDVNQKGKTDWLIGAPLDNNQGKAYLFMGESGWRNTADVIFHSTVTETQFGYSVAIINDINGGQHADIVIGAPYADSTIGVDTGEVYLYLGEDIMTQCTSSWPNTCNLYTTNASVIIKGKQGGERLGSNISQAGDFNQDNLYDFMIGAPGAHVFPYINAGKVYLYLGNSNMSQATYYTLTGQNSGSIFSSCLSHVGDVNGDGFSDVLVGASQGKHPTHLKNTGTAYLFLGKPYHTSIPDVTLFASETNGSKYGQVCQRAFDIDKDGFEDMLISAPSQSSIHRLQGATYIYFGKHNITPVPDQTLLAGQAGGKMGSLLLTYDAPGSQNILSIAPGIYTLYSYLSIDLCNPSNTQGCASPSMPSNSQLFTFKPTTISLYDKRRSIFMISDYSSDVVYIYENNLRTPIFTVSGINNSQLGFSLSSIQ